MYIEHIKYGKLEALKPEISSCMSRKHIWASTRTNEVCFHASDKYSWAAVDHI